MQENSVKVLQVISSMGPGGVENVLYNYLSRIDNKAVHSDFTCFIDENGIMRERFEAFGATIYHLPKKRHFIKCIRELKRIIKQNKYDIVHIHLSYDSTVPLIAAFLARSKVRIVHYHDDNLEPTLMIKLSNFVNKKLATHIFYCSKNAFTHNGFNNKKPNKYIPNIIQHNKYLFNENKRNELRKQYDCEDKVVVGFVGRLTYKKNPLKVVKVAHEISKLSSKYYFIIVGNGELLPEVKQYIDDNHIDNVTFAKDVENAYWYYSTFDLLLFPSIMEGFGLVLTEAEINGLNVLKATKLPEEADYRKNALELDLNESDQVWAEKLISISPKRNAFDLDEFNKTGLNADFSYNILKDAYFDLLNKPKEK